MIKSFFCVKLSVSEDQFYYLNDILLPRKACYGIAMISCLSVRLSVTLVDCDYMRWNSSDIISRLISLTFLLSADPNIMDLLQREHPQIFLARIGVA